MDNIERKIEETRKSIKELKNTLREYEEMVDRDENKGIIRGFILSNMSSVRRSILILENDLKILKGELKNKE